MQISEISTVETSSLRAAPWDSLRVLLQPSPVFLDLISVTHMGSLVHSRSSLRFRSTPTDNTGIPPLCIYSLGDVAGNTGWLGTRLRNLESYTPATDFIYKNKLASLLV